MSQTNENSVLAKFATPLIILATIIWGSSFVVMKSSVDVLPTFWLLAIRFSFAALVLAVVFIRRWKVMDRHYLIGGTVMGFCLFVAYAFQTYGLEQTTPGKNAFLTAVYCVIVPFLYWIVAKRRPDKFNVIAALLCIIGIGLVSVCQLRCVFLDRRAGHRHLGEPRGVQRRPDLRPCLSGDFRFLRRAALPEHRSEVHRSLHCGGSPIPGGPLWRDLLHDLCQ